MRSKLSKKDLVLITGGSGLLGSQYVKAVKELGATPLILDINKPARKLDCLYIECDITRESDVRETGLSIIQHLPSHRIYGLINNAAIDPKFDNSPNQIPKARLEVYPLEQWNKEIAVGLTGAFLCSKYFGTAMATYQRGSIINVSSVLGIVAPNQTLYKQPGKTRNQQPVKPVTYSVIKHGIIGLTRYLATYWADRGVRVNAIAPGGVYNNHPPEFVEKLIKYIPLGRMAEKNEYNGTIKYLLSDDSSFTTGTVISTDGGQTTW